MINVWLFSSSQPLQRPPPQPPQLKQQVRFKYLYRMQYYEALVIGIPIEILTEILEEFCWPLLLLKNWNIPKLKRRKWNGINLQQNSWRIPNENHLDSPVGWNSWRILPRLLPLIFRTVIETEHEWRHPLLDLPTTY